MQISWQVEPGQADILRTFLREKGITRSFLTYVKQEGQLLVNGQAVTVRKNLQVGDEVAMWIPPEGSHETVIPSFEPLEILFEDDYFLALNKPPATASIPSRQHPDRSMANRVKGYLLTKGSQDLVTHVVTRLDRDTTGVILFAKHRLVHGWMDQVLRQKQMHKTYLALVHAHPAIQDHGFIDQPIGRSQESIISRQVTPEGKASLTEYWLEASWDYSQLVSIRLHTGRTHQIRVHFSWLGAPLIGDDLYGGEKIGPLDRQALHCHSLTFPHPITQEEVTIQAPLPKDMQAWIEFEKGGFLRGDTL